VVAEYVKKIFKYVKKVNMYGYKTSTWEKGVIINTSSSPRSSTSPRRRWSRRGDEGKKQLYSSVSRQVVDQVLLAQAMNQERTSPPASCKVLHHRTCTLWPKVWKAM
jgi:hypothetical protein